MLVSCGGTGVTKQCGAASPFGRALQALTAAGALGDGLATLARSVHTAPDTLPSEVCILTSHAFRSLPSFLSFLPFAYPLLIVCSAAVRCSAT